MRGHDNTVEPDLALAGDRQDHTTLRAADAGDMGIQMDPAAARPAKRIGDAAHIFARPALHRAPLRTVNEVQQLVVLHELEERADRIIHHRARRAGPDGGSHRQQMILDKGCSIILALQEPGQRFIRRAGEGAVISRPVETHEVAKHRPVAGPQQVRRLCHQAAKRAFIFAPAIAKRNGKTHVAVDPRHRKPVEQSDQIGIVKRVENNEPGVDWNPPATKIRFHRVAVSTKAVVALKQMYVGMVVE